MDKVNSLKKLKSVLMIFFSILFGLVLFEFGLRLSGVFKVYSEKLGREYSTNFDYWHKGHYLLLPPNKLITYRQKEIESTFMTNSFGMRNPRIEVTPADSVIRILCLGDSYTEGDGASSGLEYPRQLETLLNSHYKNTTFEVVNAGRNGSDILYAEKILINEFYKLSPQIVILTINETDIDDIIQRGGVERFKNGDVTRYNKSPRYHDLYKSYHVFRFFVHVFLQKDYLFLNKNEREKQTQKALAEIRSSVMRIQDFTNVKGIVLFTVTHPLPNPHKANKKKNKDFNIHFCNYEYKMAILNSDSIIQVQDICMPLLDSLQKYDYSDYAWTVNGHFNNYGYLIMANCIFNILVKSLDENFFD